MTMVYVQLIVFHTENSCHLRSLCAEYVHYATKYQTQEGTVFLEKKRNKSTLFLYQNSSDRDDEERSRI